MGQQAKNIICLWYNGRVEEAARFYAVHPVPGDYPDGKELEFRLQLLVSKLYVFRTN